jgi:hypothetical protein
MRIVRTSCPRKLKQSVEPYYPSERRLPKNANGSMAVPHLDARNSPGKFPTVMLVRVKIASFAGISGRTLEKIQAIVEAAERQPRRFGQLVDDMDRHSRIDTIYRKLLRIRDEDQTLAVKPLKGKFKTIVIDPPWDRSSVRERARPAYATMTQKELLALPVASWADDPVSFIPLDNKRRFVRRFSFDGRLGA